jgi:hypothetical protein
MPRPQPDPDPDGLWPSCDDEQPGVSIRPLSHADLAALLDHLEQYGRHQDPGDTLGSGAPVVAVRVRASVGRPGASAHAEHRRRRAIERAAWTRGLPWRVAAVLAAGVTAGLLVAQVAPGLAGRGRRVPEVAWELFLARVRPCEAVAVGVAAVRQGHLVAAEGAYRVAIDAEDLQAGPVAACRLGLLRLYQGDGVGAEEAFRLAVASGHAEAGPEAATWLGGLLARRGDADAGRAVLRQAVASGHYLYAPEAAMAIGLLLADQGGSRRPWRRWPSKLRPVTRTCRRGRRCCWAGCSGPRGRWLAPAGCLSGRSPPGTLRWPREPA